MKLEENGTFPFLDVQVKRKSNNILGHSVYRKQPTRIDNLNAESHHQAA